MITDRADGAGNSQAATLHVITSGFGTNLVLLHGWGLCADVWAELLPWLTRRWRVTCIDLPGHGMSPASIDPRDLDTLCTALRRIAPDSAVWMGWSMGGLIALAYAIRYPHRVRRLVLVASQPRFTRAAGWSWAVPVEMFDSFSARLHADVHAATERFLALQVQGGENQRHTLRALRAVLINRRPDVNALMAGLALLRETDLRVQASSVTCPVRLILGERDALVPAASGPAVTELFNDARGELILGSAHAPFLSHPRDFTQTLERFLYD